MLINITAERATKSLKANDEIGRAQTKASLPDWNCSRPVILKQTQHTGHDQGPVTMKQAEKALQGILSALASKGSGKQHGTVSLASLEKISMNDMVLMAANLSMSIFSNSADSSMKATKIMTDTQEFLSNKKVKEYQEQLAKAVEQSDKAQKGGVVGAIFDWVVGAAEFVYGAMKLFEGFMTSDPLAVASGVAYLSAGVAGMVKAAAETAILCGADKDKCRSVINVASKVQLGCEIVGTALDIFKAYQAISAAGSIGTGTEAVMKEAGSKLAEGINKGSSEAVSNVAKEVGQQVAEQVSEQVMANLTKEVADQGGRKLIEAFSKQAIEQLVTRSIEAVGEQAIKKGGEVIAKEITKQVVKEVNQQVIKAAIKACMATSLGAIRGVGGFVVDVNTSFINVEKANIQKQMEELILKQNFVDFCYDFYVKAKELQIKSAKDLIEKQSDSLNGASKGINQTGAIQARIAGSTV